MKVIILGACGGIGRYVATSVSLFQEINHLGNRPPCDMLVYVDASGIDSMYQQFADLHQVK